MKTQYTVMKRYRTVRYGDEVFRIPVKQGEECSKVEPWEYTWLPWIGILAFIAIQVAALVSVNS